MEEFDFEHPRFLERREDVRDFLRLNYRKYLSEQDYVKAMKDFYKNERGKLARKKRCSSNLRREYRHLMNKYGFFKTMEEDLSEAAKDLYGEPTIF